MKQEGTYASVTRGVSQQAPADRLEGQHGEVINLLSDPVRGLVRRNGMILESELIDTFSADPADALTDSYSYRLFSYRDDDLDYDLLYRGRARVGSQTDAHLQPIMVRNKTPGSEAWLPVVRPGDDATAALFESGGISTLTTLGSYVLLASNTVVPAYDTEAGLSNLSWGNSGAFWVRGGGYGRTYTVRAKRASDGLIVSISYTTPTSTYPGVLNLGLHIPPSAYGTPWEQTYVNAAQAEYDTNVNQWASTASAAIVPSAIAQELAVRLTTAGLPGWTLRGSHALHDDLAWIEVSDGGNGEWLRAVLREVKSVDDLTDIHRLNKVVKVQPSTNTTDAYYVKAYPKVAGNPDPFQTVLWREAAGVIQRPTFIVGIGRVVGSSFYWASTPTRLQALILAQTAQVIPVPGYVESTAGDTDSVSPPAFFGRPISLLTTFQDRLVVGSGSVINMSERGDYFNFYRTTMLTIPATDPTEVTATGTETDTLRTAAQYDQNLLLQGDQFHYAIPGKQGIDAATPKMNTAFTLKGGAYAQPIGIGKYLYILKDDPQQAASRLLQIQAGVYQDSPELNDVSKQLRDYINGSPAEMVALTVPGAVFVRTEFFMKSAGGFPRARPWGLYLYQYMDGDQGERLTEAWSAWEWSTALGTPIGISDAGTGDSILLYTISFGSNAAGTKARGVLVQKASARSDPTGLPYLDGLRPAEDGEDNGMYTPNAVQAVQDVVFTAAGAANSFDAVPATTDEDRFAGLEHPHYTVGDAPPETVDTHRWDGAQGWLTDFVAEHPTAPTTDLWTGVAYPAFVDLTNPFVRDRDGKAKTRGTLNLVQLYLNLTRSAGVTSSWIDYDGTKQVQGFREEFSRVRYNQDVFVGREVKDVQVRVSAVDWLPLTINSISWKGNWFASRN